MARRFGYSRVSTSDQDWSLQLEALTKAGVDDRDIFREKASGANRQRTELRRMLDLLRSGDHLAAELREHSHAGSLRRERTLARKSRFWIAHWQSCAIGSRILWPSSVSR